MTFKLISLRHLIFCVAFNKTLRACVCEASWASEALLVDLAKPTTLLEAIQGLVTNGWSYSKYRSVILQSMWLVKLNRSYDIDSLHTI